MVTLNTIFSIVRKWMTRSYQRMKRISDSFTNGWEHLGFGWNGGQKLYEFGVSGTTWRAVYNLYWSRQIKLMTLNTIFSVVREWMTRSYQRMKRRSDSSTNGWEHLGFGWNGGQSRMNLVCGVSGTTWRAVYNPYWSRQLELVTLNTIFSVVREWMTRSYERMKRRSGSFTNGWEHLGFGWTGGQSRMNLEALSTSWGTMKFPKP